MTLHVRSEIRKRVAAPTADALLAFKPTADSLHMLVESRQPHGRIALRTLYLLLFTGEYMLAITTGNFFVAVTTFTRLNEGKKGCKNS